MYLFYAPGLKDNQYQLPRDEARHCIKVLRLKLGDKIYLTDGKGNLFGARIIQDNPDLCRVQITEKQYGVGIRSFHLHIGIAPPKNIKRFEWFLEKATEIGIDEITPLNCFHSERRLLKLERGMKVIISAMKQSLKTCRPILHEMMNFQEFFHSKHQGLKYIACGNANPQDHIRTRYITGQDVTVLIGPEGDFSSEELNLASKHRFHPVHLGKRRLRTETAAMVACSIINLIND